MMMFHDCQEQSAAGAGLDVSPEVPGSSTERAVFLPAPSSSVVIRDLADRVLREYTGMESFEKMGTSL
jgi:hypothetical protein